MQTAQINGFGLVTLALILVTMKRLHSWGQHDVLPALTKQENRNRAVSAALLIAAIALSWLALLATKDFAGFAYFQF